MMMSITRVGWRAAALSGLLLAAVACTNDSHQITTEPTEDRAPESSLGSTSFLFGDSAPYHVSDPPADPLLADGGVCSHNECQLVTTRYYSTDESARVVALISVDGPQFEGIVKRFLEPDVREIESTTNEYGVQARLLQDQSDGRYLASLSISDSDALGYLYVDGDAGRGHADDLTLLSAAVPFVEWRDLNSHNGTQHVLVQWVPGEGALAVASTDDTSGCIAFLPWDKCLDTIDSVDTLSANQHYYFTTFISPRSSPILVSMSDGSVERLAEYTEVDIGSRGVFIAVLTTEQSKRWESARQDGDEIVACHNDSKVTCWGPYPL